MLKQFITSDDVEQFVIDQGLPKELIVSRADFLLIYRTYRQINDDDQGPYIQVMRTKVRQPGNAGAKADTSNATPIADLDAQKRKAEEDAVADAAAQGGK